MTPLRPSFGHYRTFTTTPNFLKKKDKSKKNAKFASSDDTPDDDGQVSVNRADAEVPDPYDFSELEAGIGKALGRLKDALGKTRNAGRVSVEMIEGLGVELRDAGGGKGAGGGVHRVKLGDIATVVPKGGRMVQLYAQEEGVSLSLSIFLPCSSLPLTLAPQQHIKPLTASILSSPYSLTPGPDTSPTNPNPLILNIPIPPATAETRAQAAAEAKKSLERALQDIRMARGEAQKRFRKMELGKLVGVDELRKAHKSMEEVVKKGEGEGRVLCEGAVKALER